MTAASQRREEFAIRAVVLDVIPGRGIEMVYVDGDPFVCDPQDEELWRETERLLGKKLPAPERSRVRRQWSAVPVSSESNAVYLDVGEQSLHRS